MLRVIPCLLLSGCCCCWPFGGDGGGGSSYLEDYVEDRIAEEVGEAVLEAAIGAEDVEVGPNGEVTITTADGTIEAREGEDGSVVITDGDGNVLMAGGDDSSIPADFPVAPYPGSTVVSVMNMPDGQLVTWQVQADAETVLSHYRSQLQAQGTVEEAMNMDAGDGRMAMYTTNEGKLSMMFTTSPGEPVVVAITRVP